MTIGISILPSIRLKYPDFDYVPPGRMPKVLPEYKEQARKRILEVACAEFARRGYRDTSLSDIAASVGVSKSAMYGYFKSKEELLGAVGSAVIENVLAKEFLLAKKQGLNDITDGAFERVTASVPSWFPDLICDFLSEAHRNKSARERVREMDLRLVRAISEFWEERKKAGEVCADVDTEALSRGFVALLLGLMAFVSSGIPRSEAVRAWKGAVKLLMRGLEP